VCAILFRLKLRPDVKFAPIEIHLGDKEVSPHHHRHNVSMTGAAGVGVWVCVGSPPRGGLASGWLEARVGVTPKGSSLPMISGIRLNFVFIFHSSTHALLDDLW